MQTLIDSILELYPECKTRARKSDALYELLATAYHPMLQQITSKRQEISAQEQARREQVHVNETATRRIAELEHKIQESERERHRLRQDRDGLVERVAELQ